MDFLRSFSVLIIATAALQADDAVNKAIALIEERGGKLSRDEKAPGKPVIHVDLIEAHAADADLKIIVSLNRLQRLSIAGPITDVGLKELVFLKELRELELHSKLITEQGLKVFSALPLLDRLSLPSVPISAAGLKEVGRIASLRHLNLFIAPVTDDGLKELKELHRLETLNVSYSDVTDAGLKHLAALKNLRELSVDFTKLTDAGVKELARQRQWRMLSIACCDDITNASVLALANQKELVELDLSGIQITDASMEIVGTFSKLQGLNLLQARVTDDGLKHLTKLKKLEYLDLGSAPLVTEKGIADLKKALPKCEIHWEPPLPLPRGLPQISKIGGILFLSTHVMSTQMRTRLGWLAVLLVTGFFILNRFNVPELILNGAPSPYTGAGVYQDISRGSWPFAVPGYAVQFSEFELSRDMSGTYHFSGLPNIGRPSILYFDIEKLNNASSVEEKLKMTDQATVILELREKGGKLIAKTSGHLHEHVRYVRSDREFIMLYQPISSVFVPDPHAHYIIDVTYHADDSFQGIRGHVYLECGGSK